MSARLDDLPRLVELVETKLRSMPPVLSIDAPNDEWTRNYIAREKALERIRHELIREGARTRTDRDPASFALAGIRSTATAGLEAAMRNWIVGAKLKLHEAGR